MPARAANASAIAELLDTGALHVHRQGWGGGQRVHPGRECAGCAENNAPTMCYGHIFFGLTCAQPT